MDVAALTASLLFWFSFAFSPGPFWAAWTNHHAQTKSWSVYKVYMPYMCLVHTTQVFLIALAVRYFGQWQPNSLLLLYLIGGGFIVYLAIKSFKATFSDVKFEFGFKQMMMVGLFNAKIYSTVPLGALSASYFANQPILNALVFSYVLLIPIVFMGSVFFALIGKYSAKLSVKGVRYFTSSLLLFYGFYLIYSGITLVD